MASKGGANTFLGGVASSCGRGPEGFSEALCDITLGLFSEIISRLLWAEVIVRHVRPYPNFFFLGVSLCAFCWNTEVPAQDSSYDYRPFFKGSMTLIYLQ